jgi:hypothetical protein
MTKYLFRFFGVMLTCLIISCAQKEKKYEVEVDRDIEKIILSYIKGNNLDLKSKVVATSWVVTPNDRTDVYISNINSNSYKNIKYSPSYYSVLDTGVVVFVFTNIENLIDKKSNAIVTEIDNLLISQNIVLKPDSGNFYYAPTWLYSSCGEQHTLIKKLPPFEYNFVPCGYVLLQDTVKKDSLYIMRRQP